MSSCTRDRIFRARLRALEASSTGSRRWAEVLSLMWFGYGWFLILMGVCVGANAIHLLLS
jgi:hypothetical protein